MKYNKLLPLIIPIISFIGFVLILKKPELIYISGSFLIILHFFAARQLLLSARVKEKWWNIAILPAVSTAAIIMFSLFLPRSFFNYLLYALNMVLMYMYYRIMYYYLIIPEKYEKNSLENFSSYANFINIFFISSSVYGFQVLLGVEFWILILAVLLFAGLSIYQGFWANGLGNYLNLFYIVILCVVLVEIAWTLSFLPLSYFILGLILSVCYYVILGLTKHHLLGILNKRLVKLYLVFGLLSILTVMLTARWL